MKRTASQSVAAISLLIVLFATYICVQKALAETRPHYGGMLRVQLHDQISSLDPVDTASASVGKDRMMLLVYDRLTSVDKAGHLQQGLAQSWDTSSNRNWKFHIRANAKFHDGSPVTLADVVTALQAEAPEWKVRYAVDKFDEAIFIELPAPDPFLPARLALPRYSIFKRAADNIVIGSGPFTPDEFQPGKKLTLKSNDAYWGGRPYVDGVEVWMGVSLGELLRDRRLDRDDVVEAPLEQVKLLTQAGQRVMLSSPTDLIAILFMRAPSISENAPQPKSATEDIRVRQAIALAIDRASIQNVVLQKQGEAAQGVLPNWMTGYGFLFPTAPDTLRAKNLRTEAGRIASIPASLSMVANIPTSANTSLVMAMDPNDATLRAVADRIIVNAREAGISIVQLNEKNLSLASAGKIKNADFVLVRVHMVSSEPAVALHGLAESLNLTHPDSADSSPNSIYKAETMLLEGTQFVPIVYVPLAVWLHPRVHNWRNTRTGEWDLCNVWLEEDKNATQAPQ